VYLTREEERLLEGEGGYAGRVAMRILAALGDVYGADRLIPARSAHVAGVSHRTLGGAVDFLERLRGEGARVRVYASLNPCGLDLERWAEMPVSPDLHEAQLRIVDLYSAMGIDPTLTCTPYYLRRVPRGAHLAWAESSAISYANSVLGARTNREGAPSALAAALTGKTPRYGLHLDANRRGTIRVDVHAPLGCAADYGALGALVGRAAGAGVPVFRGLSGPRREWLKSMGAAMAATGAVSLCHVEGVTPEWPARGEAEGMWREGKPAEVVTVDEEGLRAAFEGLTTEAADSPDLAFVGCPHCSLSEIREVAGLVEGRRVRGGSRFWLCTSRRVKAEADRAGLTARLEGAGVEVFCDTCIIVTWLREAGIDSVATDSAKAAHYAPELCKVQVEFNRLREIVRKVTR